MSKARQLADLGNVYDDGALSNRNKIINGAMVFDQRNGGASVSLTNDDYTLDRWQTPCASSTYNGDATIQQSSTAPTGFTSSAAVTVTTATATGSNDYFLFWQKMEGLTVSDLAFGTAGAKSVTISFWVRSSITGTFGGSLQNGTQDRAYTFTYTISSANTWEYKTVTISGDTTGTWLTTNAGGMILGFSLAAGSSHAKTAGSWGGVQSLGATGQVNLMETNGATWYITGVQLEVGETATPFEHRSYGDELARCQRYYRLIGTYGDPYATQGNYILNDVTYNNENRIIIPYLNPPMRSAPSVTHVNWSNGGTGALTEFSAGTIRSQTAINEVSPMGGGYAQFNGNFGNPARYVAVFDAEL